MRRQNRYAFLPAVGEVSFGLQHELGALLVLPTETRPLSYRRTPR